MTEEELVVHAHMRDDLTRPLRAVQTEAESTSRALRRMARTDSVTPLGRLGGVLSTVGSRLRGLDQPLRRVSDALGRGLVIGARTAAIGLGALTVATTAFALRSATTFENARINLETLTGSAQKGAETFRMLRQLDPLVPFDLQQMQQVSNMLLGFGTPLEKLHDQLVGISDVAATTADPQQALNRIARAVGQIQGSGVVRAEELNQLIDAGVAVGPTLEKAYGQSLQQLRSFMQGGGDLPAGTFLDTLLTSRPGAAERAATGTLTGLLSSVRSRIQVSLADAASPLVASLKEALPQVEKLIGDALDHVAPPLTRLGVGVISLVTRLLPAVEPILAALATGLEQVGRAAAPALDALTPLGAEIGDAVGEFFTTLVPLMPDLVDAFVGLVRVLPEFVRLLAALLPIVGPIARLVANLTDLAPVRGILAGLLVTLLGYRALSGVVGALYAFAGGLGAISAAEGAAGGAGAAAGGAGLIARLAGPAAAAAGGVSAAGAATAALSVGAVGGALTQAALNTGSGSQTRLSSRERAAADRANRSLARGGVEGRHRVGDRPIPEGYVGGAFGDSRVSEPVHVEIHNMHVRDGTDAGRRIGREIIRFNRDRKERR